MNDPMVQKVSVGPNLNQHLATIVPSYSFNNLAYNQNNNLAFNSHNSSNSNGFGQQPLNIAIGPQSPNNYVNIGTNRQNEPNSFRNFEKPVSNYQITNTTIPDMLQPGKI